jgi:hypothetical protein
MPVAMIPMPSVLNQTSMMTLPSGVSAIVEATGGMIGVATVLVAMTLMPSVLMPTVSPQQTLCGPTLAVVVDGWTRLPPNRDAPNEHGISVRVGVSA